MRRLALCSILAAASCGIIPATEVVMVVTTDGIRIPADIDQVRVSIYNRTSVGDELLHQITVRLCHDGLGADCKRLPLTVTLYPGPERPGDSVRVLVEGLLRSNQPAIAGAGVFTFAQDRRLRLDFVLYGDCLGEVDCSRNDQICGPDRRCRSITPEPFEGMLDLAFPMSDLSMPDFGDVDLAPDYRDMSSSADLSAADFAGCLRQCGSAPKPCGPDGCGGVCGSCDVLDEYCHSPAAGCLPCGGLNQFCCPETPPRCNFSLVCNMNTKQCEPPPVGLEPPCGAQTQPCCPGMQCNTGLTCQSNSCHPPQDMLPPCGMPSGTCCAAPPQCMGSGYVCFGGSCVLCGDESEPCCASAPACNGQLACRFGYCEYPMDMAQPRDDAGCSTGYLGQACCPGGYCYEGTCSTPGGPGFCQVTATVDAGSET
jgi:hypothetical protein